MDRGAFRRRSIAYLARLLIWFAVATVAAIGSLEIYLANVDGLEVRQILLGAISPLSTSLATCLWVYTASTIYRWLVTRRRALVALSSSTASEQQLIEQYRDVFGPHVWR